TREALARSEAYCRALEVRVAVLETHARRLEWQRQAADNFSVQHIMRTQALEAGAHDNTLEDTKNPKNMHTARPCNYADFLKCHPLNFKGIEGAVGLTPWIEKMESVFNISGSTGNTSATNNRGGNGPNPRGNGCFECGNPRHFKRDCPKLNNKNGGNRNAQRWVYVVGNAERNENVAGNPDLNVVTGCHVFLVQISATKEDDKPEGKQVKDVPIVQDFPEVFPEDLPGLPPARTVEFQIDLIPRAVHVARAPYRLAPSKM
nr:reverse transcriptase domain-containing protein [Tanacetum cinerariifolium]